MNTAIINQLINLFQKLYNLTLPQIPQDISEPFWQKCLWKAKRDVKRRHREAAFASGLGSGYSGGFHKPNKAEKVKEIEISAKRIYSQTPFFQEQCVQFYEKVYILAEKIYMTLYPIQVDLQKEPAARGTLLLADAQTISRRCEDKQLIYVTISALRAIWAKVKSKQPASRKAGETKKGKSKVKPPSEEAKQAYQLRCAANYTQSEIADIMNEQLHRKDITQYKVSRMIKSVEKWYEANNLPIESKPTITPTNPKALTMGLRTDGKRTGDPRIKPI